MATGVSNITDELLANLSPEEKEEVMKILHEMEQNGMSKSLEELYNEDYDEVPVDIDTFIEDDHYIGKFTGNGTLIYPYWREQLRNMFSSNKYQEVALTGCLSGDTMIPLLNGKLVSMKELSEVEDLDEYVYSFDVESNQYVPGHLIKAFSTGVKNVYRITLDNGESIIATSNHKFMTRDKHWKSIDTGLSVGDSMMPFNTVINNRGYELIKHPQKDGTYIEELTYRDGDKEYFEEVANYNHKIVSIEYVGEEKVYDLTVEKYHNFAISSGIVAHNSIGIGKSTIACIAMAYLLYQTMCLKDPQKYYRLAAGSTIVFAFFNNTLDLTTSVGYGTIQNICQNSPWFLERGTVSGLKYKEYIPNKLIRFRVGSQAGHALGTNIISAMIDEVNFKQGANVRMEQSKIMETYNGVLERMGSRFMVNGKIAGKLFIVSSKKSEYDFLESYIRKKKDDPTVMVCDAKLWEVKPMGTYSGNTFAVAVGGSNLPSRILNEDESSYTVHFVDGSTKLFRHNDMVKLSSGVTKRIQDIEIGDDIIG